MDTPDPKDTPSASGPDGLPDDTVQRLVASAVAGVMGDQQAVVITRRQMAEGLTLLVEAVVSVAVATVADHG